MRSLGERGSTYPVISFSFFFLRKIQARVEARISGFRVVEKEDDYSDVCVCVCVYFFFFYGITQNRVVAIGDNR